MILDESQRIKNPSSKAAVALHSLGPLLARRVIMTGTPVANRPYDIWSQVYFLDGGESLGVSYSTFKSETDFKKELGENRARDSPPLRIGLTVYTSRFAILPSGKRRQAQNSVLPGKVIRNTPANLESGQSILYEKVPARTWPPRFSETD